MTRRRLLNSLNQQRSFGLTINPLPVFKYGIGALKSYGSGTDFRSDGSATKTRDRPGLGAGMGGARRRRRRAQSRPDTSEDIHWAIFAQPVPAAKKVEEFDQGVRRYLKKKHARR